MLFLTSQRIFLLIYSYKNKYKGLKYSLWYMIIFFYINIYMYIHMIIFLKKIRLSYLFFVFTYFSLSNDNFCWSKIHLIYPNKFFIFSSIRFLSNTLSLMGKVNSIWKLNNISTFSLLLLLHLPVVINLIMI